jgi:hypothetical protein
MLTKRAIKWSRPHRWPSLIKLHVKHNHERPLAETFLRVNVPGISKAKWVDVGPTSHGIICLDNGAFAPLGYVVPYTPLQIRSHFCPN